MRESLHYIMFSEHYRIDNATWDQCGILVSQDGRPSQPSTSSSICAQSPNGFIKTQRKMRRLWKIGAHLSMFVMIVLP